MEYMLESVDYMVTGHSNVHYASLKDYVWEPI